MFFDQPYLPRLNPAYGLDYVFFAFLPRPDDAERIVLERQRLEQTYGLTGLPIAVDRLHVSLHCAGIYERVPSHAVEKARRVAATVVAHSVDIVFDHAMTFRARRSRPLVLLPSRSHVLIDFRKRLGEAMRHAGIRRSGQNFTPHMTLLYDERVVPEVGIVPLRWKADRLFLICSHRGRGTYERLGEWRL